MNPGYTPQLKDLVTKLIDLKFTDEMLKKICYDDDSGYMRYFDRITVPGDIHTLHYIRIPPRHEPTVPTALSRELQYRPNIELPREFEEQVRYLEMKVLGYRLRHIPIRGEPLLRILTE